MSPWRIFKSQTRTFVHVFQKAHGHPILKNAFNPTPVDSKASAWFRIQKSKIDTNTENDFAVDYS